MKCSLENIPNAGLFGIVLHKIGETAKNLLKEFDLNKTQANILFTLHSHAFLSQKELAEHLNVTAPSITSAIQKMERNDYIMRRQDENDQRIMRLGLTEKGEACIAHVKQVARQMDELIFRGMSAEERMLLRRLMIQIYENLDTERKE